MVSGMASPEGHPARHMRLYLPSSGDLPGYGKRVRAVGLGVLGGVVAEDKATAKVAINHQRATLQLKLPKAVVAEVRPGQLHRTAAATAAAAFSSSATAAR